MRALVYAILCLALPAAAADVYRWVDEKGTVHYSNETPPNGVKATKVDIEAEPRAPVNETGECYTVRCQGDGWSVGAADRRRARPPARGRHARL